MGKKNCRILAALLTAALCLVGVALAANEGTASDPLITLSYLNQTVTPDLLNQMDTKVNAKSDELKAALEKAISEYSQKMEQALSSGGGGTGGANYTVVTLTSGQKLQMDIGCEVILRVGSATCVSPSSPGLIDITGGSTLNHGGSLTVNHLYMATIEGRAVSAGSGTVKVLVRGGYTVG